MYKHFSVRFGCLVLKNGIWAGKPCAMSHLCQTILKGSNSPSGVEITETESRHFPEYIIVSIIIYKLHHLLSL